MIQKFRFYELLLRAESSKLVYKDCSMRAYIHPGQSSTDWLITIGQYLHTCTYMYIWTAVAALPKPLVTSRPRDHCVITQLHNLRASSMMIKVSHAKRSLGTELSGSNATGSNIDVRLPAPEPCRSQSISQYERTVAISCFNTIQDEQAG